jgi:hypothetical protein
VLATAHAAAEVVLLPVLVMLLPDKAFITFHLLAAMYNCILGFDMLRASGGRKAQGSQS